MTEFDEALSAALREHRDAFDHDASTVGGEERVYSFGRADRDVWFLVSGGITRFVMHATEWQSEGIVASADGVRALLGWLDGHPISTEGLVYE